MYKALSNDFKKGEGYQFIGIFFVHTLTSRRHMNHLKKKYFCNKSYTFGSILISLKSDPVAEVHRIGIGGYFSANFKF